MPLDRAVANTFRSNTVSTTIAGWTQYHDGWVRQYDADGKLTFASCNEDGYVDAAAIVQAGTTERGRRLYGIEWIW